MEQNHRTPEGPREPVIPSGASNADRELMDRVSDAARDIVPEGMPIVVTVRNGHISVTGRVNKDDQDRLLRRLAQVPGVSAVENHLSP